MPTISGDTAGAITSSTITAIIATLVILFGNKCATQEEPVGETITEEEKTEEPIDGTPLHLIKENDKLHVVVALEPAPTQLLWDYVTGEKKPKCFVKPMNSSHPLMGEVARVHITIPTLIEQLLVDVEYHVTALSHGVHIHSRLEDDHSAYSVQFGTLQGFVQFALSPGHLFETCEVTPYFKDRCVAFEPESRAMQQAKWLKVNEIIVNYYENGC